MLPLQDVHQDWVLLAAQNANDNIRQSGQPPLPTGVSACKGPADDKSGRTTDSPAIGKQLSR